LNASAKTREEPDDRAFERAVINRLMAQVEQVSGSMIGRSEQDPESEGPGPSSGS